MHSSWSRVRGKTALKAPDWRRPSIALRPPTCFDDRTISPRARGGRGWRGCSDWPISDGWRVMTMLRAVWCRPHLHHAVLSQLKRGDPCFVLQQTDAQKIGLMSEKDPLCERCQNDG